MTVKARFTIEGLDPMGYEGQHDPAERWNGWATPRFTEAAARRIAADIDRARERDGDEAWDRVLVHNDPVAFDMLEPDADPEGDVEDPGHALVEADEDGLFALGAYGWVWEVVAQHVTTMAGGKVHLGRTHDRGTSIVCTGRTIRGLVGTTEALTCIPCRVVADHEAAARPLPTGREMADRYQRAKAGS